MSWKNGYQIWKRKVLETKHKLQWGPKYSGFPKRYKPVSTDWKGLHLSYFFSEKSELGWAKHGLKLAYKKALSKLTIPYPPFPSFQNYFNPFFSPIFILKVSAGSDGNAPREIDERKEPMSYKNNFYSS